MKDVYMLSKELLEAEIQRKKLMIVSAVKMIEFSVENNGNFRLRAARCQEVNELNRQLEALLEQMKGY